MPTAKEQFDVWRKCYQNAEVAIAEAVWLLNKIIKRDGLSHLYPLKDSWIRFYGSQAVQRVAREEHDWVEFFRRTLYEVEIAIGDTLYRYHTYERLPTLTEEPGVSYWKASTAYEDRLPLPFREQKNLAALLVTVISYWFNRRGLVQRGTGFYTKRWVRQQNTIAARRLREYDAAKAKRKRDRERRRLYCYDLSEVTLDDCQRLARRLSDKPRPICSTHKVRRVGKTIKVLLHDQDRYEYHVVGSVATSLYRFVSDKDFRRKLRWKSEPSCK